MEDFKSVKTFKFFNTNNLWVKLPSIKRIIENGTLDMEVIVNPKTLDNGVNVIQLETAVGAAMKCFEGSIGILKNDLMITLSSVRDYCHLTGLNVPRSRFLPVKKTSDLLLVMSNLYNLKYGSLSMSPLRSFPSTPLIKLGENHFAKVTIFFLFGFIYLFSIQYLE